MLEKVNSDRLTQLKALLERLAVAIDGKPGARDLASLVRQYRETLREIEDIEGGIDESDEIQKILSSRPDRQSNTDGEDSTGL